MYLSLATIIREEAEEEPDKKSLQIVPIVAGRRLIPLTQVPLDVVSERGRV